jgi:ubiquinone/menaquinone biosynthesis C-methylase UbiE
LKNVRVEDAYNAWSATYDSDGNLTRDLDERVARRELQNMRTDSVLELGCGTGKNTKMLADIGERVHSLDFSVGMIEKARQRVASAHVTFEVADLTERWPVADQLFDLVVCNLVLEHIEDLNFIFGEAGRVLSDGGRFFVCELHPFRQYQGTQARFQQGEQTTHIPAFLHHTTDFLHAAQTNELKLVKLDEWWHEEDQGKPPRLISFLFAKSVT